MSNRTLPRPTEPTKAALKEHADPYNRGLSNSLGIDSVGDTLLVKQGMIGYLSEQWVNERIPRHEIAEACGAANTPIEWWHKGEKSWGAVLQRLSSSLNAEFV